VTPSEFDALIDKIIKATPQGMVARKNIKGAARELAAHLIEQHAREPYYPWSRPRLRPVDRDAGNST
jgi:hypothetical protein